MANVLVMIPAGEVYNHDCVRWYDYLNTQGNINHYHNIGDAFVYDSSLKLLNFDRLEVLEIRTVSDRLIDRYNAEFDYCFIRGSNYINPRMEWRQAPTVLERLRIPVLAFGIGAQTPSLGDLALSDDTRRVLRLIADSTTSIGVRGDYSAEVLWQLGIKNVRVVGCPTAFRRNRPDLRIDLPPLDQVAKVGVTLRREVSREYAKDISQYLTLHRDLVKSMADRFDVELMAQGEIEEKKLVFGTEEQKQEAIDALMKNKWFADWYMDDRMIELYRSRLFYSDVVADYEDLVRSKDLVIGYRLHGNLMALASGIPAIYFSYDSRTLEFAETFGIPCHDVFSEKPFQLEDYWDQALFERFNRLYYQRYRDMSAFLNENLIDHKMASGAEPVRAPHAA